MSQKTLKTLELIYSNFFNEMNIDSKTGILKNTDRRFATKPAIGENYFRSNKKILFISLDIGKDELFVDHGINSYQSYEDRKSSVCTEQIKGRNRHMAGVYGTSLYLLQNSYNWEKEWEIIENSNKFFKDCLNENYESLPKDVLKNISLLNFFNFVEIGRDKRTGNSDRIFINKNAEIKLNIDVINTLKPDEIIVHGSEIHNIFKHEIIPNLKHKCNIYLPFHPSVLGKNIHYQVPRKHIENMNSSKISIP